jgi:hypothetical protein
MRQLRKFVMPCAMRLAYLRTVFAPSVVPFVSPAEYDRAESWGRRTMAVMVECGEALGGSVPAEGFAWSSSS